MRIERGRWRELMGMRKDTGTTPMQTHSGLELLCCLALFSCESHGRGSTCCYRSSRIAAFAMPLRNRKPQVHHRLSSRT